jgi:hypothetical protein
MSESQHNHSALLHSALEFAKGVYLDDTKSQFENLTNTVIVTACNFAYLNHLANFKCFIDRLRFKALVFSLDMKAHSFISDKFSDSLRSYPLNGDNDFQIGRFCR